MPNQWKHVEWDQIPFEQLSRHKKRERLLKEANYACTKCDYDKRRDDGGCILEIDHINGDHNDNRKENLQVICPNCHALTPNFRNWGRSTKKTSTRLRKENAGYAEARKLSLDAEKAYIENFKTVVMQTYDSGEIDYSRFGWVQKLSDKLNDSVPQAVGKRVKRLMPEFYVKHCFLRSHKRLHD